MKFGKTNLVNSALVNSAIVINRKHISMSLHIPQLKSVIIVQPDGKGHDVSETDFTKKLGEGGLGITDVDLYYITVPVDGKVHILTTEGKKVIVECTEDGVKKYEMPLSNVQQDNGCVLGWVPVNQNMSIWMW